MLSGQPQSDNLKRKKHTRRKDGLSIACAGGILGPAAETGGACSAMPAPNPTNAIVSSVSDESKQEFREQDDSERRSLKRHESDPALTVHPHLTDSVSAQSHLELCDCMILVF